MKSDIPANSDAPVIEMSAVAVEPRSGGNTSVLEEVNWTVMPGDYWVIGGMHGSGKTDLLEMTAGLSRPQKGRYQLFGCDMPMVGDQSLPERMRIGLVFDGGNMFHGLTVAGNVELPLLYHRAAADGDAYDRVKGALELTGLLPWADHLPGSLGRGWQKRAGLARAMVLQPEILLLDNPLGGLDSRHIRWWLDLLGQLSAGHEFMGGRPMTLVIAAEDLRPWRNLPASFAIVQDKRFVTLGRQPQLAGHSDPLVRELLAEPLSAA